MVVQPVSQSGGAGHRLRPTLPGMGGTEKRRLNVIPEPAEDTRSVIVVQGDSAVAMRGEGPLVWTCGSCGAWILDGMEPGQVQNLVFRCHSCGAYNETLD